MYVRCKYMYVWIIKTTSECMYACINVCIYIVFVLSILYVMCMYIEYCMYRKYFVFIVPLTAYRYGGYVRSAHIRSHPGHRVDRHPHHIAMCAELLAGVFRGIHLLHPSRQAGPGSDDCHQVVKWIG